MLCLSGRNRKGSIYDPMMVGAVILGIAITILIMLYVWGSFATTMKVAVSGSVANETVSETIDALTITYSYIDYMIPMLVGGLMLVSLIFAFKTGASIIYAFFSLIAWAFAILMATVYTNVFEQVATSFSGVSAPILSYTMMNFKWIVLGWLFLVSLVMYTRSKKEDVDLNKGLEQYYA